MQKIQKKLIFIVLFLLPASLSAQERLPIGVGRFEVNGPPQTQYLAKAAQDAVVGSLIQKGYQAHSLEKVLDPDKLQSIKKWKKSEGLVVAGRISVVGSTYRVRLKWVDIHDRVGEDYLQVEHLDQLLPNLETFAANRLQPPTSLLTKKEKKEEKRIAEEMKEFPPVAAKKVEEPKPAPVSKKIERKAPEPKVTRTEPEVIQPTKRAASPPPPRRVSTSEKESKKRERYKNLRDYDFISERLPFEVRGLAYADIDGDGKKDVLLTSQRTLHLYRFQEGKLELLSEYPGGKLDYFVKVDVLPSSEGGLPLIVLTNLKGDRASSKILKFSGGQITPVADKVPYQLRVVQNEGNYQLVGSPYSASSTHARRNIFLMALEGSKVKPIEKLKIPQGIDLYNFDWARDLEGAPGNLVVMSEMGKLRFYKKEDSRFKKVWTSRENYGGSGNYVPVEVKNTFNEVVSDFYSIPPGVRTLRQADGSDVLVVKNSSLVKNVIGRIPLISHGRIVRLSYDQLGFVETWASKKVDGSIQDYLVTSTDEGQKLMAAVRLREPGLLGDMGRNDSVLLLYNLN